MLDKCTGTKSKNCNSIFVSLSLLKKTWSKTKKMSKQYLKKIQKFQQITGLI